MISSKTKTFMVGTFFVTMSALAGCSTPTSQPQAGPRDHLIGWYELPNHPGNSQEIIPGSGTLIPIFKIDGTYYSVCRGIETPLKECPDGLEWVAEQKGFLSAAQGPAYRLIPDYVLPGVHNEALATILAGIVGVLIVLGVAAGLGYARRNRSQPQTPSHQS